MRPLRRVMLVSTTLVWACLILLGARTVMKYENAAATPGEPSSRWPVDSRLPHPAGTFVLIMAAHPDCPCTRASVTQLEQLMARLRGKLAAFVLFSKPEASEQDVRAAELWIKAAKIPGSRCCMTNTPWRVPDSAAPCPVKPCCTIRLDSLYLWAA